MVATDGNPGPADADTSQCSALGEIDLAFARFRRTRAPAALDEVFRATSATLRRTALKLVRDPERADDLVQATFVVAMENPDGWDPQRPVEPWLRGILIHRARHVLRTEQLRGRGIQRNIEQGAVDPCEVVQRRETVAQLELAIEQLPEPYQSVVRLRLQRGLDATRIGEIVGRPPGTVRMQISRGLDSLRRQLPDGLGWIAAAALLGTSGRAAGCRLPSIGAILMAKKWSSVVVAAVIAMVGGVWMAASRTDWRWSERSSDVSTLVHHERSPSPGSDEVERMDVGALDAADAGIEKSAPSDDARLAVQDLSIQGLSIQGRVECEGKPVVGARVLTETGDGERIVAESDEHGRFEVARVEHGEELWARAAGFVPSGRRRVEGPLQGSSSVVLRLRGRGHAFAGIVVDGNGEPVPHARGMLALVEPVRVFGRRTRVGHAWVADANGRFECDEAPEGEHVLVARHPSSEVLQYGLATVRVERGAAAAWVEVRLVDSPVVTGRVVDEYGNGLVGASVQAFWLGLARGGSAHGFSGGDIRLGAETATSAANGEFRLTGFVAGRVSLRVGYRGLFQIHDTTIEQGVVQVWNPIVELGSPLRIECRGADEEVLDGWGIRVRTGTSTGEKEVARTTLDSEGRAVVQGLEPGVFTVALFRPCDRGDYKHQPFEAARFAGLVTGSRQHLLRLARADALTAAVRVRLVHGDRPLAATQIDWRRTDPHGSMLAFTDVEGVFELTGLPPGEYAASLLVDSERRVELGPWRLFGGECHDLGEVKIAASAGLSVELSMPSLVPSAHPSVYLVRDGDARHERIHLGGELPIYRSRALDPGEYWLHVRGEGLAPEQRRVSVGIGERKRITLSPKPGCRVCLAFEMPATRDSGVPGVVWYRVLSSADRQCASGTVFTSVNGDNAATVWLGPGRFIVAWRTDAAAPFARTEFEVGDHRELTVEVEAAAGVRRNR